MEFDPSYDSSMNGTGETLPCQDGWEHDKSQLKSSIVQDVSSLYYFLISAYNLSLESNSLAMLVSEEQNGLPHFNPAIKD